MPDWARTLEARLASLGVEPTRRAEIIAELAQHLADAERDALEPGEGEHLARALAGIERSVTLDPPVFGKARHTLMTTLWQDIKYAVRSLRLNPAYAAIVLGTLALGIGANAAIFSVADAVMLRPYPYPDMDRILVLTESVRGQQQQMSVAWPTFQDWQAQNQSFEHLGIYRNTVVTLTGGDQPERLNGAMASSGVFGAMGMQPVVGRVFGPADDAPGSPRVAIISERVWRGRFNADPGLVGQTAVLNNEPHVIVGVMPAGMRFPSRLTDVWLSLGPFIPTFPASRGSHPGLFAVARLKPGVSFEAAVADMDTVARRIGAAYPDTNKNLAASMTLYYEQIVRGIRPTLVVLLGAVGFVLLIGCANLANLMLARSERRQREIAVRSALGAERRRIIQQLMTESLLLAVAGGALGVLLATWIVKLLVASRPVTIPRIDLVAVDARVIAFAAALSLVTGVVFGLVPALRASTPDLLSSLKQSGRGGQVSSRRFRSTLVVVEVALALILLVGAGLMIRSFTRLMAIDPGFNPDGVVTMRLTLPPSKYPEVERWTAFHEDLLQRVSAIAGVTSVGINSAIPLEGGGSEAGVAVEGRPLPTHDTPGPTTLFQASSAGYLPTMGIPLVRGRYFTDRDARNAAPVVIVDETLVQRVFPGEDPIGKRISFEFHGTNPRWREIVGVVGHVRHYGLASEPPFVQVYVPFGQLPIYMETRRPAMALAARTALPPEALTGAIRRELAAIDRDIPVYGVGTLRTYLAQNTEQPRLSMMLLSGLGALALVLAVIGIYGVISYSVAQRTQEIGLRMALGATRSSVMWMVVGQAAIPIGIGIGLGIGGAFALSSYLRAMLYQVSERDPATLTAIALLLTIVGLMAAIVPARRATRVDPLVALRSE
jgi:putative ABC transport system permease protein